MKTAQTKEINVKFRGNGSPRFVKQHADITGKFTQEDTAILKSAV